MLLIAVAITVAARAGIVFVSSTAFREDPDAYRAIALTIAEHRVFGLEDPEGNARATAFRPPLYPMLLSSLCSQSELPPLRLATLHVVFAALTTLLVFDAVLRLTRYSGVHFGKLRPPDAALLASLIVALDPVLLRQSTEIMTETLAALLATAVIWAWIRLTVAATSSQVWCRAAGLGLMLGASYLCRPPFLAWAVFICAALAVTAVFRKSRHRKHFIAVGLVAGMCALAVVTWTMRNRVVMGHPIWATSHGGYTLLLANNESFYDHLKTRPFGSVWDAGGFLNAYQHRYDADPREASFWYQDWKGPPRPGDPVTEHQDDRVCAEAAFATIRRRPAMFAWSCVIRAFRLWSPIPHAMADRSRSAIALVATFYVLLYAAVAIAVYRNRDVLLSKPCWSIWLLVFTLTLVHSIYWSNLRMRAPAIPALAMMAVMAGATSRVEDKK